jgi:hypothetical protein
MKHRNVVRYAVVAFIATLLALSTALLFATAQKGKTEGTLSAAMPIEQREGYENCRLC